MRILFLGAGATGGYYGARLVQARTAAEVSFLLRTRAKAELLRDKGLRVLSPHHGDVRLDPQSFSAFSTILEEEEQTATSVKRKPYDVILLCCKAYDLESACQSLKPFADRDPAALILPVLNGLAHMDVLDRMFGKERVVGGVSHVATTLLADGITIKQLTPVHRLTFGARPGNSPQTRETLERLRDAFAKSIVEVRLTDAIEQELWEKFVLLATLAGSTCLARASVGDIMNTDDGERIVHSMLNECIRCAERAGHPPRMQLQSDIYARLTERGSPLTASMMRDMEGKGKTEARHIVYDMLRRCREGSTPSNYLEIAWMVLQARDQRVSREENESKQQPKL